MKTNLSSVPARVQQRYEDEVPRNEDKVPRIESNVPRNVEVPAAEYTVIANRELIEDAASIVGARYVIDDFQSRFPCFGETA